MSIRDNNFNIKAKIGFVIIIVHRIIAGLPTSLVSWRQTPTMVIVAMVWSRRAAVPVFVSATTTLLIHTNRWCS